MLRTRAILYRDGQRIDAGEIDAAWDDVPLPPRGLTLQCPDCDGTLRQDADDLGVFSCDGCDAVFLVETETMLD